MLHSESADCTRLSSPSLASHPLFTLSPFYFGSGPGLPIILFNISFSHYSPRLRFVVFYAFLTHLNIGTLLSNHDDKQAIAPFLITIQVANRRASAGDVVSGDFGSIPSIRVPQSTGVGGTPSEHSASLTGMGEKTHSELGVKAVTAIDWHHNEL